MRKFVEGSVRMPTIYEEIAVSDDILKTLDRCCGWYRCPKDNAGKRLGPLVGHAGTYTNASGEEKHYVSEEYFNFAMAETYPHVSESFARRLAARIYRERIEFDCVLGAPMGGLWLAGDLGRITEKRRIFAEKRNAYLPRASGRDKSCLILERHSVNIKSGDRVLVVEDVCNNFSTSDKLVDLVHRSDARVVAIVCEMNRSSKNVYESERHGNIKLPVISLVWQHVDQYRQDDERVIHDIAIGNVIWSPKDEWPAILSHMRTGS